MCGVWGAQRMATTEASCSSSRSDTSRGGQGSMEVPSPRARGCTAAILLSSARDEWMSGHETALSD